MSKQPIEGGSYKRDSNGEHELVSCTGDRPCKCRPGEDKQDSTPATDSSADEAPIKTSAKKAPSWAKPADSQE